MAKRRYVEEVSGVVGGSFNPLAALAAGQRALRPVSPFASSGHLGRPIPSAAPRSFAAFGVPIAHPALRRSSIAGLGGLFGLGGGPGTDRLEKGESLTVGQRLRSNNTLFQIVFEPDGNLTMWATNERIFDFKVAGKGGTRVTMHPDGNFAMHRADDSIVFVFGRGNRMVLSDDGNFYLEGAKWKLSDQGTTGWLPQHVDLLLASGLFDAAYYIEKNPGLDDATLTAYAQGSIGQGGKPLPWKAAYHYLAAGAREGRDPHRSFSTTAYYKDYPDVRAAEANPIIHFVKHGKAEGRKVTPTADDPRMLAARQAQQQQADADRLIMEQQRQQTEAAMLEQKRIFEEQRAKDAAAVTEAQRLFAEQQAKDAEAVKRIEAEARAAMEKQKAAAEAAIQAANERIAAANAAITAANAAAERAAAERAAATTATDQQAAAQRQAQAEAAAQQAQRAAQQAVQVQQQATTALVAANNMVPSVQEGMTQNPFALPGVVQHSLVVGQTLSPAPGGGGVSNTVVYVGLGAAALGVLALAMRRRRGAPAYSPSY